MTNDYIIALDLGSSASRAVAINAQGKIMARSTRPVETLRPADGQAQLDAVALLQGQLSILDEIVAQIGLEKVAGLAIANALPSFFGIKKPASP